MVRKKGPPGRKPRKGAPGRTREKKPIGYTIDFDDAGCPRLRLKGDVALVLRGAELARDVVKATIEVTCGETVVYRDRRNMSSAQSRARFVRDLEKKGVTVDDDALVQLETNARLRLAEEQKAAASAGSAGEEDSRVIRVGKYVASTDSANPGLYVNREFGLKRLTNFCTRIVEQELEDDGVNKPRRNLVLESILRGGRTIVCAIPASDLHAMQWVMAELGSEAIVEAGSATKDEARTAIQAISGSPALSRVFTHTGFREIDGTWHYLHGAGAIGPTCVRDDVTVRLSELPEFRLPAPPTGEAAVAAVRASLALFEVAPLRVTTPVLAAVYLAPLREALGAARPDFVLWIHGASQEFKSELAALAQAHFGPFTRLTLPANFLSTQAALELKLFMLKDALLVVDDYMPATNPLQAQRMQELAAWLLRSVGNATSRGRADRNMRLRLNFFPRALPVVTAERLPLGHSNVGRLFQVPIQKGDIILARLKTAQAARDCYAEAMALYVQWIAARMDSFREGLPARFQELRDEVTTAGGLAREPGQTAHLLLGIALFLEFAVAVGALDVREARERSAHCREALLALGDEQREALASERPVARALAYLRSGFAARRIYLEAKSGGAPAENAARWGWECVPDRWQHETYATLIGWLDGDYVLLEPEEMMTFLYQAARDQGETFPVGQTALLQRFKEEGLIVTKGKTAGDNSRLKVRERAGGRVPWVVKLRADALEADDVPAAARSGNGSAAPEAQSNQEIAASIPTVPLFPRFADGMGECESSPSSHPREPGEEG